MMVKHTSMAICEAFLIDRLWRHLDKEHKSIPWIEGWNERLKAFFRGGGGEGGRGILV